MSTSDQPDTPPLTRRQLREIRNTGSTPVISPEEAAEAAQAPDPAPAAPLPRAAAPAPVGPAPLEHVDLGVSPLTRRQARHQERIRTASVPVITPDVLAEHQPVPAVVADVPASGAPDAAGSRSEPVGEVPARDDDEPDAGSSAERAAGEPSEEATEADASELEKIVDAAETAEDAAPVQVDPALGSGLLEGDAPAPALPASFDQLIARNTSATGSVATPNALILSQTPAGAPLVAPVTATGEVLITGTFELPEGLGSVGHAPGVADGKDLDVSLIDGELPPASSPTPIAASAAISTARNSGEEIIRPPAPDKSHRLTLALVITIGVLAVAVAGVLIYAVATGRI